MRLGFFLGLMTSGTVGVFVLGCATVAPRAPSGVAAVARPAKIDRAAKVVIELKSKPGTLTQTAYSSTSKTLSYSDGQLVRERTESVDFKVSSKYLPASAPADQASDNFQVAMETVEKDGTVDLHDLSFPELKEEIVFWLRKNGEVLRAGKYPSNSLFFVPSLPIPQGAVSIGDTWDMQHNWTSAGENIPLKLDVVAIFKDLVPCEGDKICADIELSGGVSLVMMPQFAGNVFESRIRGRLLFSLERGDVIWSEMRSREVMVVGIERTLVDSCIRGEMKLPRASGLPLHCEPSETALITVPQM